MALRAAGSCQRWTWSSLFTPLILALLSSVDACINAADSVSALLVLSAIALLLRRLTLLGYLAVQCDEIDAFTSIDGFGSRARFAVGNSFIKAAFMLESVSYQGADTEAFTPLIKLLARNSDSSAIA